MLQLPHVAFHTENWMITSPLITQFFSEWRAVTVSHCTLFCNSSTHWSAGQERGQTRLHSDSWPYFSFKGLAHPLQKIINAHIFARHKKVHLLFFANVPASIAIANSGAQVQCQPTADLHSALCLVGLKEVSTDYKYGDHCTVVNYKPFCHGDLCKWRCGCLGKAPHS